MKIKKRRLALYTAIGLIFGILDWFYLDWLAWGLGPNLGQNRVIAIPVIVIMNYGVWLVPIIPVVIYETKLGQNIKDPILAGALTWCSALTSYYAYYASLLSLGKLPHLEHLNIFGARADGFWWQYTHLFLDLIIYQLLEWLPIAIVGGGLIGALSWWIFKKRAQKKIP